MADFNNPILILCGNSGCGKSTTVRLLCETLSIETIDWNDDYLDIIDKNTDVMVIFTLIKNI
jgi:ABC-type transport system involved in cytochrome bd biosynthesis fused ATPase/permease subunit